MNIKKMYYYLFYKLYKFSEAAPSRWLSDWKAGISIVAMELWILLSIGVYYTIATKTAVKLSITMPIVFIPLIVVGIGNYLCFFYKDKWKSYAQEFESWPQSKNKLGSWIVVSLILLVIANLIFSLYLMTQIDWSRYR